MANGDGNPVTNHPAEVVGLAGAVGLLIARVAGVDDPDTIVAIGVVVAAVPAAITWAINTFKGARRTP